MKNNSSIGNFLTLVASALYIISALLTGAFFGSDFSNVMLPITLYILFTLLITQRLEGYEEKRLIDLNNIALLSYGISYILFPLLSKFAEDKVYLGAIFLGSLLVCTFVFIFVLRLITKKNWWK
ncbi:hypothetical protein [Staphylococcus epidermidis]|uniref:hypothetical protein n=1 Tax=Staphylococcus epidermidis TaxID=1282 RepID=UPI002092878B|nr:hypothetical protein [Staphylococcus epidermidis]MCG2218430.1 hypothetical protein [Staphylococcus epidermidis]MCO6290571.1 hypothetical protein [Staphylococcus epidermidis]